MKIVTRPYAEADRRRLLESGVHPLLAALRSGHIDVITVHVPDASVSFETIRGDLRRFWRRPRPLAAYARDAA